MTEIIDIVLPCYNPNDKWPLEIEKFYRFAGERYRLQFIIVNDGSVNGNMTSQLDYLNARNIPAKVISYEVNRGKGYALRQGVMASGSRFVIYTDIDLPFTNDSMLQVIRSLLSGTSDIVAGYRDEKYYASKMTSFRRLLSKSFRFFLRSILQLPLTDTQCGLKGFNEAGKTKFLATTIDRYLFDFEFIYSACRDKKIKIGTVPVTLKDDIVFSRMPAKVLLRETVNLGKILLSAKAR